MFNISYIIYVCQNKAYRFFIISTYNITQYMDKYYLCAMAHIRIISILFYSFI